MNIGDSSSGISYLSSNINTVLSLGLTIIAEILAFFLFIFKKVPRRSIIAWVFFIFGINCVSIPLAQLFYNSLEALNFPGLDWFVTEILVILAEASLIYEIMDQTFQRALRYSMLLNITSILLGAILCWFNLLPWCY